MNRSAMLVAALALATAAHAQKPCSKADEGNAGKAIDRITSWATLNGTWKTYRHCDNATVGPLFTEAVLRLVVDWKGVNQLADGMKDPEYGAFILAHLKSEEAKSDAPDVYSRAKANCPKGLEAFCKEIAEAVREPPPPQAPTPTLMPPIRQAPAAPDKK